MTTQKALNIGKAGFHVLVMLLAFIPMTLFIIITGFFKIWEAAAVVNGHLDDGKEDDLFENDEESTTSMVVNKGDFSGHSHRYDMGSDKELVIFKD